MNTTTSTYSDNTRERILAFLDSMRALSGVTDLASTDEYDRGHDLVKMIARESNGTDDPNIHLSLDDCANLAWFLSKLEPRHPTTWWTDPEDAPSHVCGLHLILQTLEDSIRAEQTGQRSPQSRLPTDDSVDRKEPLTDIETANTYIDGAITALDVIVDDLALLNPEGHMNREGMHEIARLIRDSVRESSAQIGRAIARLTCEESQS